jgi:hypothetical protein
MRLQRHRPQSEIFGPGLPQIKNGFLISDPITARLDERYARARVLPAFRARLFVPAIYWNPFPQRWALERKTIFLDLDCGSS